MDMGSSQKILIRQALLPSIGRHGDEFGVSSLGGDAPSIPEEEKLDLVAAVVDAQTVEVRIDGRLREEVGHAFD
jgi:hypothetical protein